MSFIFLIFNPSSFHSSRILCIHRHSFDTYSCFFWPRCPSFWMGKLSPRWRLSHPVVNIFFHGHVQRSTTLSLPSLGKQTWHVLAAEVRVPLLALLVAPLWRSSLILSVPWSPNVPSPCQVTPLSWQLLYNVCTRTAAKNCVFSSGIPSSNQGDVPWDQVTQNEPRASLVSKTIWASFLSHVRNIWSCSACL